MLCFKAPRDSSRRIQIERPGAAGSATPPKAVDVGKILVLGIGKGLGAEIEGRSKQPALGRSLGRDD
jgi:hypothetical protein